ncbi:MAG: hypothetical protein RL042_1737 [Nitrospirota bacterium]
MARALCGRDAVLLAITLVVGAVESFIVPAQDGTCWCELAQVGMGEPAWKRASYL